METYRVVDCLCTDPETVAFGLEKEDAEKLHKSLGGDAMGYYIDKDKKPEPVKETIKEKVEEYSLF